MRHVHIGPGALGLGLIVDKSLQLRCFETLIVGRHGSETAQELQRTQRLIVHELDTDAKREWVAPTVVLFDPHDLSTSQLSDLVADPSTMLITISVGRNELYREYRKGLISPLCSHLIRGLARRSTSAEPLLFLACENHDRNSTQLRAEIEHALALEENGGTVADHSSDILARAHFADCIVDRICAKPRAVAGAVQVDTESYHEWSILDGPASAAMNALATTGKAHGAPSVLARDDFDFRKKRKYWSMNGTDIILAVYAERHGLMHVRDVLRHAPGQLLARAFTGAVAGALWLYGQQLTPPVQLSETVEHANRVLRRIASNNMTTERVIRELQEVHVRAKPWTRKFRERVVEPLQWFMEATPDLQSKQEGAVRHLMSGLLGAWEVLDDAAAKTS